VSYSLVSGRVRALHFAFLEESDERRIAPGERADDFAGIVRRGVVNGEDLIATIRVALRRHRLESSFDSSLVVVDGADYRNERVGVAGHFVWTICREEISVVEVAPKNIILRISSIILYYIIIITI
jgi:hypothetical protein